MNRIHVSLLALAALSQWPASGWAQMASEPGVGVLEEIIVTANRREQNLQEVAISVAAFTGEFLKETGTTNLKQLEQYTPSLKITPVTDSRSTSIRIRGIGSIGTNAGIDPSVGLFIDGIYQGRAGMSIADLMDVERIEVLRGPQGTLYGKNTAAGAVSIISRRPAEVFEAELEGVYGNYDDIELRGMVNIPVGNDGDAVRLSGYTVSRDGYDDNTYTGGDINDAKRWGTKARGLLNMNDYGELLVTLDYAEEDSNCCAPDIIDYEGGGSPLGLPVSLVAEAEGKSVPVPDPLDRNILLNQPFENNVKVGGVAGEWHLDMANDYGVTWINAWRFYKNDSIFDGDFTHLEAAEMFAKVDLDQYSSELRLTSPEGEKYDYVAGLYAYYSKMDTDGSTGMLEPVGKVFAGGLLLPGGSINYDSNTHETTSYAAFGQFNYNFNEQWRLTLGARYTYEEKSRDGTQISRPAPAFPIDAPPIAGPDFAVSETRNSSDVSPTASLSYFMTEDLMLYASFSQGFKSGGFNQLRTAVGVPGEFDDERSTNYELGWKGSWLSRRLMVNGTAFYVDYDDFQAQGFDGANITVRNAGSLESKGLELETTFVPSASWIMGMALGYNDAEYQDFPTGECTVDQLFAVTGGSPFVQPDCVQDLGGESLDNAPKWTVSNYVQYEGPVAGTALSWIGRLEYNYTDSYYMAQDLDENLKNDSVGLFNARLSLFGEDRRWEATLWGRNLTDEEYYVVGFDVPLLSGYAGINAPPRTYGITVNYRAD